MTTVDHTPALTAAEFDALCELITSRAQSAQGRFEELTDRSYTVEYNPLRLGELHEQTIAHTIALYGHGTVRLLHHIRDRWGLPAACEAARLVASDRLDEVA